MKSPPPKRLESRLRIWLELDGRPVYGDGKHRALERIEETGSLRAAAKAMGISYRYLWGRLRRMEERLGFRLVARRQGGPGGGGMEITREGRALMAAYRRFRRDVDRSVGRRSASRRELDAAVRAGRHSPRPKKK